MPLSGPGVSRPLLAGTKGYIIWRYRPFPYIYIQSYIYTLYSKYTLVLKVRQENKQACGLQTAEPRTKGKMAPRKPECPTGGTCDTWKLL